MSSSIVGAQNIEKKDFSCFIRTIVCRYTHNGKKKTTTLYHSTHREPISFVSTDYSKQSTISNGLLLGEISNQQDNEFFFITNHNGQEVQVECVREINLCSIEQHHQYILDYVNIDTRELKSLTKNISDGKITLRYFNIFFRTGEYAEIGTEKGIEYGQKFGENMCSRDNENCVMGELAGGITGGIVGGTIGSTVGHLADLFCSLRFFCLPRIDNDKDYGCNIKLIYKECPHRVSVPIIIINTYPDIVFYLKIGVFGVSKSCVFESTKKEKGKDKLEKTSFSFEFSAKYADTKKYFNIDKKIEEKTLQSEDERKAGFFANAIYALKVFFNSAVNFTQTLQNLIENTKDGNSAALENHFSDILYTPRGVDWIQGSLDIEPNISAEWRYSVSEDLKKLGKYLKVELGINCTGKLIINLVEVAAISIDKSKKTAKVAAVASSVASGGLAALPAALITFLVDYVVDWLKDKFKEGLVCNLIISGTANTKSFSIELDTSKEDVLDGTGLTAIIKPEIKIIIGFNYKTSITLFWMMNVEGEAKAITEATASLTWKMILNVEEQHLGMEHDVRINPLILKVECMVVGSFEISGSYKGSKIGTGNKTELACFSHEWKTSEYKLDPNRHTWFKVNEEPYVGAKSGGGGR